VLTDLFNKENLGNKSKFLLLLGIVGVLLILVGDFVGTFTANPAGTSSSTEKETTSQSQFQSVKSELETGLATALSQVAGVGEVEVQLKLATGGKNIYARNTSETKETTTNNSTQEGSGENIRHNTDSEVVILNKGGEEEAVVKESIKPRIEGVLIIAEGAQNSSIKFELMQAVKVGLGIPSYKIAVLPKGN
jgi:stage III sporulation protein AG